MSTYRRPKSVTRLNRTRSGNLFPDRSADDIEEVPAGAVFDFENPKIGVKLRLPRQIVFDFRVRCGLRSQARRKDAIGGARLKRALWRGSKQLRRSIQPADAYENRTCFFGAAPTHDSGTTFDLAASQIGRNPQGTLEAHRLRSFLSRGQPWQGSAGKPSTLAFMGLLAYFSLLVSAGKGTGEPWGSFPTASPKPRRGIRMKLTATT